MKNPPAEPKGFNPFNNKWAVRFHGSYMVLPYIHIVSPTRPFIQVVRHVREYGGESVSGKYGTINHGDIQRFLVLHYDESREAYEVLSKPKTNPAGNDFTGIRSNFDGRDPIEKTLSDMVELTMSSPESPLPFMFKSEQFFHCGKTEKWDVDDIACFQSSSNLSFVRKYHDPSGIARLLNF